MDRLTERYWENVSPDDFECLVKDLLEVKYPNQTFRATPGSWDGSKDIVTQLPFLDYGSVDIWFECKRRKKTLAFQDVSMTFLMAYIHDCNKLAIFSYSPVNREFHKHVSDFAERRGKNTEVKVFDDCALEQLIFMCREDQLKRPKNERVFEFDKYFPHYSGNFSLPTGGSIVAEYAIGTPNDANLGIRSRKLTLSIGDTLQSRLYLTNNSHEDTEVCIWLDEKPGSDCLQRISGKLRNGRQVVTVPSNSTTVVKNTYRVRCYKHTALLPHIKVHVDGVKKEIEPNSNLDLRWLAETDTIGDSYKRAIRASSQHALAPTISCVSIIGASGTGKSRVLKEVGIVCMAQGKRVIHFDTDKDSVSSKLFARRLVSAIEKLPLFDKEKERCRWISSAETENRKLYAAHVLYDDDFDPEAESDRLTRYLVDSLEREDLLLILDNVQNYDEIALGIIDGILNNLPNDRSPSSLAFGVNLDYVMPGTRAQELKKRLSRAAKRMPAVFQEHEIVGFSKCDARTYIRTCLGISDNNQMQYRESIDKIVQHHGTQPLFLQHFLLYLEQNQILDKTEAGYFYVRDIERFQDSFKRIPDDMVELIEKRHDLLERKIKGDRLDVQAKTADLLQIRRLFGLLAFMKMVPFSLYRMLFSNFEILEYLEESGFIKKNSAKDGFTFYHEYYEKYYRERFAPQSLNDDFLERFIQSLSQLHLEKRYVTSYFISSHYVNRMTLPLYHAMLEKIHRREVERGLEFECFNAVMDLMRTPGFEIGMATYVKTFQCIDSMMEAREGIDACLPYNEILLENFENDTERYEHVLPQTARILEDYLVRLLNARRSEESLDTNKKLMDLARKACASFPGSEHFIMQLHNRQSMVYNARGVFQKSLAANGRSLAIAEKTRDVPGIISAYRGAGDIYHCMPDAYLHRKEIALKWSKAYRLYVDTFGEDIHDHIDDQLKVATYSKALLASLMLHDYAESARLAPFVHALFGKTGMTYYEIRTRISSAMQLLAVNSTYVLDVRDEVFPLIDRATDLSAIYGKWEDLARCYHLHALLSYFLCDYSRARDQFVVAFQEAVRLLDGSFEYACWKHFFMDAALLLRRMQDPLSKSMRELIQDESIKKDVSGISTMAEDDFCSYYDSYQSMAPITTSDGKLGFPRFC